uniref:SUEL-type lectin domain-containing protein n=1 Tax=Astatotilapia calliptera TaxID=8154 RepID=A0A3P8PCH1_ASTCA
LFFPPGVTRAKRFVPSTATAISSTRVITCDGHLVQHLCCEAIVVYWADYGRRDTTTCSQHRPTHEIQNAHCPNPTTKVADRYRGSFFPQPDADVTEHFTVHPAASISSHLVPLHHTDDVLNVSLPRLQVNPGFPNLCKASVDSLTCFHSCNGKSSCIIEASNSVFGDPCPGTYKYLEVAYDCEPCEGSQANLHCDDGHIIAVHWANYGRRDTTTCSYQRPECEIQNARCINPTSKVADSCNGKRSCIIEASNSVFGDPCPGTYKYLEVVYTCESKCLKDPLNDS